MSRYLWHLTLDTGLGRRSERSEVGDAVVTTLSQQIAEMLDGLPVEVRPGYGLSGAAARGALLATVSGAHGPLVTVAVAPSGRSSPLLWEQLRRSAPAGETLPEDAPQPPWCAVRIYPAALARDEDAVRWLGDFERCLAWAWIERKA